MLAVALETSARPPSVAVELGTRRLALSLEEGRAHASDLLPALDRLVRELGASPIDISEVIVGVGPGSYTGLRVGIATALGIARASGARLCGLSAGAVLAFGELAPGEEMIHLLDARQGELYFAHYRRLANEVQELRAPCVLTPAELGPALVPGVAIFGDATVADAARLEPEARSRLVTDRVPRAEAALVLGRARLAAHGAMPASAVEPLYLRPFAAKARRR
jgi:tRNA threonylcarbamoyladenosine biosynthesis protein TsaB